MADRSGCRDGGDAFPSRRAQFVVETASTDAQIDAEEECAPFFVDIPSLSEGHLDHLRFAGLIPPLPLPSVFISAVIADGADGGGEDGGGEIDARVCDGRPAQRRTPEERREEECSRGGEEDSDDDDRECDPYAVRLLRSKHSAYLRRALAEPLSKGFVSLDASHPWMVYWCLHSLDLLRYFDRDCPDGCGVGASDPNSAERKAQLLEGVVSTLDRCWTDVPLEFSSEDVGNDPFLRDMAQSQSSSPSDGDGGSKGQSTIVIFGGGFGGGTNQMPHLATNYAAVLALCIVAGIGSDGNGSETTTNPYRRAGRSAEEMLRKRRSGMYAFFLTLQEDQGRDGDGGGTATAFRMQHDGEIDVRASYCALAVAYLLGLLAAGQTTGDGDNNPLRRPSVARFVAACQTFEGGFGAEPFNEAHGGYTFCAIAALRILGAVHTADASGAGAWVARRQMGYEGGFSGRTNKLVDGCYSFWQGGAAAVMDGWYEDARGDEGGGRGGGNEEETNGLTFDEIMLQRYVLLVAQDASGGLRDKPSKPRDFYHSCYNLSGLSVAQHGLTPWPPAASVSIVEGGRNGKDGGGTATIARHRLSSVFGDRTFNIVGRTDPVLNIRVERVRFIISKFLP